MKYYNIGEGPWFKKKELEKRNWLKNIGILYLRTMKQILQIVIFLKKGGILRITFARFSASGKQELFLSAVFLNKAAQTFIENLYMVDNKWWFICGLIFPNSMQSVLTDKTSVPSS